MEMTTLQMATTEELFAELAARSVAVVLGCVHRDDRAISYRVTGEVLSQAGLLGILDRIHDKQANDWIEDPSLDLTEGGDDG